MSNITNNLSTPTIQNGPHKEPVISPPLAVALSALTKAGTDHNLMQIRLENQIQQHEISLINSRAQNRDLRQERDQVTARANELENKATTLETQLQAERAESNRLRAQLHMLNDQIRVSVDALEIQRRAQIDLTRQLAASDARLRVLEQRVANRTEELDRAQRLNTLLLRKENIQNQIEEKHFPQRAVIWTSTYTGFTYGGLSGAGLGFIGGTAACLIGLCFTNAPNLGSELREVTTQIEQLSQLNRLAQNTPLDVQR